MPVIFDASKNIASKTPVETQVDKKVFHIKNYKKKQKEKVLTMNSFITHPRNIHFVSQESNEYVVLLLRQHPVTQIGWVLFSLVLLLLPFFSYFIVPKEFFSSLPKNYFLIGVFFWYIMVFAYSFINFILWYYNVNIVTNNRIIDIDFAYLLVQETSSTRIVQIEDVTIRTIGVFSALFDYGNVYIQTAGPTTNIEFMRVPKPELVSRIIIQLMSTQK